MRTKTRSKAVATDHRSAKSTFLFVSLAIAISATCRGDECGFGPLLPNGSHQGTVIADVSTGDEYVVDVAVQSDGKIVTLCEIDDNFAVTRYHRDGSIDRRFGTLGTTLIDFSGRYDRPMAIAVIGGRISSRSILVAGTADAESEADFAVARLDMEGDLDPTFGGDGRVTTGFGDEDRCFSMTIQR
ncbi:MAG: hypothetical protein AAF517_05060, partial [Planctomycetota bacterium]